MKVQLMLGIGTALILLLPCCNNNPDTLVGQLQERRKGPKPEAEWNRLGIWHRIASNPPTYLPVGYAASRPRGERDGTWLVDARDHKRLFVPNEPVNGLSPEVLKAEATKATDWEVHPKDWIEIY
ncbi:MAG: hypothetical protein NTW21_17185 [Verrucomicrobia bacterium]|nr:hypothetical protein [Verrucomicrobiota bacterium]